MAYLGRGIENLSDRVVLDSLTASATASYTLQLNSVNFVPSSASSLTVSLNGVIQKPESSYTVSGSTLTFSSALTSSDSIDFIIAERGITLQTPSAGSVGTSQLANSAVDLTSKVTGALPVANGGTALTSGFANGITMVDYFRLAGNQSVSGNGTSSVTNFERVDTFSPGFIGTGVTESGGVFTFPLTGIYKIISIFHFLADADATFMRMNHEISTDSGSSFDTQCESNSHAKSGQYMSGTQISLFDVTNTSTHQLRFRFRHNNTGSLQGSTSVTKCGFIFERLGDT